ncbi:zinc ribbon domain-containing protein [Desnuesiella massiliensis]|uniref:zinc ribbon domain-containing protein n=1 Tax=Desnuesiella massiliensis TaxID=1650662 RepID=UPI0006E216AB|nr:zinc ribbon domain-containing protein [Desnuesiella massiliensis]
MGITYNGKNHIEYIKKCQHHDPIGNKCDNPGIRTDVIVQAIFNELEKYENEIMNSSTDVSENETELIKSALTQKQKDLQKNEKALDNLIEMREDGEITKDKYLQRKKIREESMNKIKKEIEELQERLLKREQATNQKRLYNIQEFRRLWKTADSPQLKNQFLKTIIDRIDYIRTGDNIQVHVNFL